MSKLIDEKQLEMKINEINKVIQDKVNRGNQIQQELENINRELQRLEGEKAGFTNVLSMSISAEKY